MDYLKKVFELIDGLNVIITVGNTFRQDDGVGPYISDKLNEIKLDAKKIKIVEARDKPENIIDDVVSLNPDKIFIIDAADFAGKPGEISIILKEQIPQTAVSTHIIPLSVISSILAKDTGADVVFVGIQTKSVGLGEGLSCEVQAAGDEIVNMLG